MNFLGNGEMFIWTWIPYSLIEFVISDLNVFMTQGIQFESTIPFVYIYSFFSCMRDEIKKHAIIFF